MIKYRLFIFIIFHLSISLLAQTPNDAILMDKNEICFLASGGRDTWNKYWEGELLRENLNIGTLTRDYLVAGAAYGITDNLNFLVALPYIKTSASGGQMVGAKGFQDVNLALKYRWLNIRFASSDLSSFVTAKASFPVSNYSPDYAPFSLGLGSNEYDLRSIWLYDMDKGFYTRLGLEYAVRTTCEVERDYYYTNQGYYTTTMDVPNAFNAELALGYWFKERSLQFEAAYDMQMCLSGDDIRRQNTGQATNKSNFGRAKVRARYFIPQLMGFSVFTDYSKIVSGRNMGKSTAIDLGLTYQFSIKKNNVNP